MDCCIHAANLLYLASYLVRDMLWLRSLTLLGLVMGIAFFAQCQESMQAPILWHVVFAAINVVQIIRLIHERRKLHADERAALRHLLHRLSRDELVQLISRASWGQHSPPEPQLQADSL